MGELILEVPSVRYLPSYLAALAEGEEAGENRFMGEELSEIRADPAAHIRRLLAQERLHTRNVVQQVTLWGIVDGEFVGRISIRMGLTRALRQVGGHIGYQVRPTARGRGWGSAMLRNVLPRAFDYGLTRVLLTCDETNVASRKVIERCGGHSVESVAQGFEAPSKLRYWIPTVPVPPTLASGVQHSIAYLESSDATVSLDRDPYWPKWHSPWWHMVSLLEIGLAHMIPRDALVRLFEQVQRHYLHTFPLHESEIPPGRDSYRHVLCHCGLGTLMRLAYECDLSLHRRLPFIVSWLDTYQLPDGGYNCDEKAYSRERKVGSFVSTIPFFEALLDLEQHGEELAVGLVDRVAGFYRERQIWRSLRSGNPVSNEWAVPIFPRFYEYDVLRGIAALATWMNRRQQWSEEPWWRSLLSEWEAVQFPLPQIRTHQGDFSLQPTDEGNWHRGTASSFPLLDALGTREIASLYLQCQWNRVRWLNSIS